jgi:hypothetical protein
VKRPSYFQLVAPPPTRDTRPRVAPPRLLMRPALAPPDLVAVEENVVPRQAAARAPMAASTEASRPAPGAAAAARPETVPTRERGAGLAPRGEVPAVPRNAIERKAPPANVPTQVAPMPVPRPAAPAAAGGSLAAQARAGQNTLRELAAAAEQARLARTGAPLAAGRDAVPAGPAPPAATAAAERTSRPAALPPASRRVAASEPSRTPDAPAAPPIVTAPAPPSTSVAAPPARLMPPLAAPPPRPQPASERPTVHIGVLEVRVIPPSPPVAKSIAAVPRRRAAAPADRPVSRPIMMYGLAQS